jgi:hypothetical protein
MAAIHADERTYIAVSVSVYFIKVLWGGNHEIDSKDTE